MTASNLTDQRTVASWAAFAVAVVICLHQRHFTLSLAHPDSFRIMLQHRCGLVLTAAFVWASVETTYAIARRFRRLPQQPA